MLIWRGFPKRDRSDVVRVDMHGVIDDVDHGQAVYPAHIKPVHSSAGQFEEEVGRKLY